MRLALAVAAAAALITGGAAADSFTPVRLDVHVARVARLHRPLAITVAVSADPAVLDNVVGALRIEVKLAAECGADFEHTPGVALLNRQLSPQPVIDRAYYALARGVGRPAAYGVHSVCVYLEEASDNRVWAHDELVEVDVSRRCTLAAKRYDRTRTRRERRVARRACGPGVPL